jgi:hypothetical protein
MAIEVVRGDSLDNRDISTTPEIRQALRCVAHYRLQVARNFVRLQHSTKLLG